MAFSDGTIAERLTGREVTWTYFRLLGITPAIGRDFTEQDGRPGNPRTVVISHGLWERRLGSRRDVVGQPIRLDGADYIVAGVLPPQLGPFERRQDFFIAAQWSTPRRKGPFFITTLGRLREGVSRSAAASELHAINRRLFPLWKSSYQDDRATWNLMDLKAFVAGDIQTMAGVALAAVALVWLIATANAANLLVARVTSRRRELAVRTALGASRGRVVRYLLAESALLAVGAAAVGLSLAWGGVRLLQTAGATLLSAHAGNGTHRTGALAACRRHDRERRPVRPRSGPLRRGRPGRRVAAIDRAFGHRQSRGPAAATRAGGQSVRHRDTAARRRRTAPRQPERASARRSRVRHPQRAHRRDPAAGGAVSGARERRLLGRAEAARGDAARRIRRGVRRRPAARRCRRLQQLRSRGPAHAGRAVAAGDALGGGHAGVLPRAGPPAPRGTPARRARCARRRISTRSSSIARGRNASFRTGAPSASGCARAAARSVRGPRSSASSAR